MSYGLNEDHIECMPDLFACFRPMLDGEGEVVDFTFVSVNSAFETMTGQQRRDIAGRNFARLLSDCGSSFADELKETAENGKSTLFEYYSPLRGAHAKFPRLEITAGTSALLNTIEPEAAVISCGKDNRYGYPHDEELNRR